MELITIGEVARALKRSVETIRAWERNGVIPRALFRGANGLRLYHPAEVECMKKILRKIGRYAKQDELKSIMWLEIIRTRKEFLNAKEPDQN